MTVAIYVSDEKDASTIIPWGIKFAHADHTDLMVVCPQRSVSKAVWTDLKKEDQTDNKVHQAVFEAIGRQSRDVVILKEDVAKGAASSSDLTRVAITVREIAAPAPAQSFAEEIASSGITLLLMSAPQDIGSAATRESWRRQLFEQAPCETAFLRGPAPDENRPFRVLIGTDGDPETEVAIQRARQLAQTFSGTVTLLYVRPDDDLVAREVADRQLEKLLKRVSEKRRSLFEPKVALANTLIQGIQQQELDEYSVVMVGSEKPRILRSVFRGLSAQKDEPAPYTILAIRESVPMASRFWGHVQALLRQVVPQLDRDQRVELLTRLSTNSRFDFDFIALISLSTLIAGLGLIRNSASVVIGAMLVAPLMSPLIGAGFALIQGNVLLIRSAMRSVLLGFAVAFAIGIVLGLVIPGIELSNAEISSRGHPNLLDLIVALASGVAAAYATGRPNLVSALPGVAIAAALVPPIATAGITFSCLEFTLSAGALLLFLTNIVAIILGTTMAFWAIGITPRQYKSKDGPAPRIWPRYWFFAFVVISFILAVLMEFIPKE